MEKTTVAFNLGVELARAGKNVLSFYYDPKGNLMNCCGYPDNDEIDVTVLGIMEKIIDDDRRRSDSEGVSLSS